MVSVLVFMEYPDDAFIKTLAVMVGVLDFVYLVALGARLRQARNAPPVPAVDLTHDGAVQSPRRTAALPHE